MKTKKLLDGLMFILLLFLMAFPFTGQMVHEWIGILTLLCFMFHHWKQRRWYQTLRKASTIKKIFMTMNALMMMDLLLLFLSGFTMSQLLPFLDFMPIQLARKIHMTSAYWGFLLIAIHTGLHIQGVVVLMKKKMKQMPGIMRMMITGIPFLLCFYGIIAWIRSGWISYLLLLEDFVYVDEAISITQIMIDNFCIFLFYCIVTHTLWISYVQTRKREENSRC